MLSFLPIMPKLCSSISTLLCQKYTYTQYTCKNLTLQCLLLEIVRYSPEAMVLSLVEGIAVWTLGTSWDEISVARSRITGLGTSVTSRLCPKMYLLCSHYAQCLQGPIICSKLCWHNLPKPNAHVRARHDKFSSS